MLLERIIGRFLFGPTLEIFAFAHGIYDDTHQESFTIFILVRFFQEDSQVELILFETLFLIQYTV